MKLINVLYELGEWQRKHETSANHASFWSYIDEYQLYAASIYDSKIN